MLDQIIPDLFGFLISENLINESDIHNTQDGFFMVYKSLAHILLEKNIVDFLDSNEERLLCSKFFDDWYLYAVGNQEDYTYSLLKLREQENDAKDGSLADGDTPGVTISFISFNHEILLKCLLNVNEENKKKLNNEINRVVAYKGQKHHNALKKYFKNPKSNGAYVVAQCYVRYIASLVKNGCLDVSEAYKEIFQQSESYKYSSKLARLPRFIKALNEEAGSVICDNEKIYIKDKDELTKFEALAILATHTGNTSIFSFAAEVEYHARYLTALAKIKIPFFGRSIYDSAIRADMTVGDTEFEGPAPFYQENSKIVKRQYELHHNEFDL